MRPLSRRDFLRLTGGAALAAPFLGLPSIVGARPDAGGWLLTTLARTIEKNLDALVGEGSQGKYFRLRYRAGEQYIVRTELSPGAPPKFRRSLLNFVHHTDMQLADAQSPARVEFLDRFADRDCRSIPFEAAFRPQESIAFQAFERMLRTVRAIGSSPVTGEPFQFAICTGDNIDNEHFNELRLFMGLMDGGEIRADSGEVGTWEGVQAVGWGTPDLGPDPEYWHPDDVPDKYKEQWGFPAYPGLLEQAIRPFGARGAGMPWYSCFGNHDGLLQGNFPENAAMEAIAEGPLKVTGTSPGFNPCDRFETLRNPEALFQGPARAVTADEARRIISREEYVREHFQTRGRPIGHGFTQQNVDEGTAYYVVDRYPQVRMIVLDTTNPGGEASGSIGAAQLAWLEQRLTEVHSRFVDADGGKVSTGNEDNLVVIFSHHGIDTMDNPFVNPDPFTPEENDLPRFHGPAVEELLHRFPNVILWVNGHSHANRIRPRPDPSGGTGGFWDVTSAAICEWPTQSRLIEITDNGNGLLSIFCTMVDHAAPPDPTTVPRSPATRLGSPVSFLASVHRELAANDPQSGRDSRRGSLADRNVDLVIRAPFPLSGPAARPARRRSLARR